jgi:hypothetical protein
LGGAVIPGAADLEAGVISVVMGVEEDYGSLVQTRFLGCRWLVATVVCGVVLCQHPNPNLSHCRCGKTGSVRAGENVFDPHFCPSDIDEGAKRVYVYRMERAANITMVQNIIGCPYLVVDGIIVPNSYIDFMILYAYLI